MKKLVLTAVAALMATMCSFGQNEIFVVFANGENTLKIAGIKEQYRDTITSIEIPEKISHFNVNDIAGNAFDSCNGLKSVKVSNSHKSKVEKTNWYKNASFKIEELNSGATTTYTINSTNKKTNAKEYYECYLRDKIGDKYELNIINSNGTVIKSAEVYGKYPLAKIRASLEEQGYKIDGTYQYVERTRWAEFFNIIPFIHVCTARDISFVMYK